MGIDGGRLRARRRLTADLPYFISSWNVQFQLEHPRLPDLIQSQQIQRHRLGLQIGLDEFVAANSRLDFFDTQREFEGERCVTISKRPRLVLDARRQLGRVDLEQTASLARFGTQLLADSDHYHSLLPPHANRLDDRNRDFLTQ
jgi:hypothetical protein